MVGAAVLVGVLAAVGAAPAGAEPATTPEVAPAAGTGPIELQLPASPARDLVVHQGRAFVSAGDEVDVVDGTTGELLARLTDLPGADGLAAVGDAVYVNVRAAGRIQRFDATTLALTGTWELELATNGSLAHAAGRLWFTDEPEQFVDLASLDPTTGAVHVLSVDGLASPRLEPVSGDPDLLLTGERPNGPVQVWDVSTGELDLVFYKSSAAGAGGATASATSGRVWLGDGRAFDLATEQYVGTYPSTRRGVAHADALGGVLLMGELVSREGSPTVSHRLAPGPGSRGHLALSDDGRSAYVLTEGAELAVWDLAPALNGIGDLVRPGDEVVEVLGTGLGHADAATIDGEPAEVAVVDESQVEVAVPAFEADTTHTVTVTTPWGTSEPLAFVAGATPPGAVVDLRAEPGPHRIDLRWHPPVDAGTAPVEHYEVEDLTGGYSYDEPAVAGELHTWLPSLAPGEPRDLRVRAVSAAGAGPWVETGPVVPNPYFTDVPAEHPFFAEIEEVAERDIADGYPDGTYRPVLPVSRQAMASFIHRWFNPTDPAPPPPPFADVPPDHPFAEAIAWLAETGMAEGYPDGTYRPSAPVSRQAAVAFLYRLYRLLGEPPVEPDEPSFSDVPAGHPFFDAVEWAAAWGMVQGYADGRFRPSAPVSRQAMAAFLIRLGR